MKWAELVAREWVWILQPNFAINNYYTITLLSHKNNNNKCINNNTTTKNNDIKSEKKQKQWMNYKRRMLSLTLSYLEWLMDFSCCYRQHVVVVFIEMLFIRGLANVPSMLITPVWTCSFSLPNHYSFNCCKYVLCSEKMRENPLWAVLLLLIHSILVFIFYYFWFGQLIKSCTTAFINAHAIFS